MKNKEYYLEKYKVIKQFTFKENDFIIYRINEVHPGYFITGDRYGWDFGLRWEKTVEHIVMDYFVEEELKIIIKRLLTQP